MVTTKPSFHDAFDRYSFWMYLEILQVGILIKRETTTVRMI